MHLSKLLQKMQRFFMRKRLVRERIHPMNSVIRSIKHIAFIIALVVCIICLPLVVHNAYAAEEVASGTCGDNLTWVLDDEGTLIISGTGDMFELKAHNYSYYRYRKAIKKVIVSPGVTSIGVNAFCDYSAIEQCLLPDGLLAIGRNAFCMPHGGSKLKYLNIPKTVTMIEEDCLTNSSALILYEGDTIPNEWAMNPDYYSVYLSVDQESAKYWCLFDYDTLQSSVVIPSYVRTIPPFALDGQNLTDVYISNGVTRIGFAAFGHCVLANIFIPKSVETIEKYAFVNCARTKIFCEAEGEQPGWNQEWNPGNMPVHYSITNSEDYKTEHSYGEWNITKEATCTETGIREKTCSVCGEKTTEEIAALSTLGHDWNPEPTVDKAATCTEEGSQSIHCSRCSVTKDAEAIPATGHSFSPWKTTKKATETATGTQTRTCSACGRTETKTIARLEPTLPAVKISKVLTGKKYASVKWAKVSTSKQKRIAKIQIQYSTDKNFKKDVKYAYAKKSATNKKITKLTSKKTYYFRIRAYKSSRGKVHVSKWSAVKSVKVK